MEMGPGMPAVEGRAEFPAPADDSSPATTVDEPPPWLASDFDSDAVIRSIIGILEQATSRCWIIFDRLDEAFESAREERTALRGLMRAQADLSSYNATFRVKLFLRSDVMRRITRDSGFGIRKPYPLPSTKDCLVQAADPRSCSITALRQ